VTPRQVLLASALLAVSAVQPPNTQAGKGLDHLIPPGYVPEEADDEKGLWLEFREMEAQLNKSALLVRDPDVNDYLIRIVCRVAGPYCDDFRVYVLRNPNFNASMTATGMLQIWTGVIVRATSTDDIAAVVAHEIAHYTRLHSLATLRTFSKNMAGGTIADLFIGGLTGIYGLGQTAAAMSFLSFSRDQETEADNLGLKLLAEAGYDPHASYHIWQKIIDEERAAEVKREKPGIFSKTHPEAEERMASLRARVTAEYGPPATVRKADAELVQVLNAHYLELMEDQLDTNRYGRTREILERHVELGVDPGLVQYFFGELYRQRNEEGDRDMAINAYRSSVGFGGAPAAAYKNLGYLLLKERQMDEAKSYFEKYLAIDPEASDRAMIEFYIEE